MLKIASGYPSVVAVVVSKSKVPVPAIGWALEQLFAPWPVASAVQRQRPAAVNSVLDVLFVMAGSPCDL